MTKRCLDEGLLQAYMDGELSGERAAEAASHIAACVACSAALAEAENESAFFSAAFAADDSLAVPSEVLRSRIGAAVAQLESQQETGRRRSDGWSFGGFLASLTGLFTLTPQRAAAFASVLVAVAAGVIYFAVIRPQGANERGQGSKQIAGNNSRPSDNTRPTAPTEGAPAPGVKPVVGGDSGPAVDKGTLLATEKGNGKASTSKASHTIRRAEGVEGGRPKSPTTETKEQMLPGEKDYQTAIASLEKTIKLGGDASLKPALRVEYERNIAILDSAIEQTRQVAAKNPKDSDAVGFLMSVYQSKVELLTKVADQAQVAALGR
jgi:Putative zinc-finger